MRSTFVTGVGFAAICAAVHETWISFYMQGRLKKIAQLSDYQKMLNEPGIKRCTQIINQAFLDIGFQGPIYVLYPTSNKPYPCLNMICGTFMSQGQRAAFVEVISGQNKQVTEKQLYAAAGHEAVHAKHKHQIMRCAYQGVTTAILYKALAKSAEYFARHPVQIIKSNRIYSSFYHLGLISGAFAITFFTQGSFKRMLEKDADLTSIKKLQTHDELMSLLAQAPNARPNLYAFFSDPHPQPQQRIAYIQNQKDAAQHSYKRR